MRGRNTPCTKRHMTLPSPQNDRPPAGPSFAGQTVVFTGKLASLGRREARALVERLGGVAAQEVTARTTMLVVGAEGSGASLPAAGGSTTGDLGSDKSNKLRKAEEVNTRAPGRVAIVGEDEFCRLGGLRSNESLKRRYHGLSQIRELYPLVREDRIRQLEKWGLIRPIVRTNAEIYYGFHDVSVVKRVHEELERGGSFRAAVRGGLAVRDGQLALNFATLRGDVHPAKVVALPRVRPEDRAMAASHSDQTSAQTALAARLFLEGSELDEGSDADQDRARVAYRKALLLDPNLVPAIVNLANIHYARDELVEAQALYERALGLEADCFEAYFNLGNIHHDLGRYIEAVAYYGDALRLHPGYADAHFYLAVTLEKMGRSSDAKGHWRSYQRLAPDGEWADLAQEFSE